MMNFKKNKKGVSPIIAVILLIALVVIATAVVFQIVNVYLTGTPELTLTEQEATTTNVIINVKNIGTGDANITSIEVLKGTTPITANSTFKVGGSTLTLPYILAAGSEMSLEISFDAGVVSSGDSITIKIYYSGKTVTLDVTLA